MPPPMTVRGPGGGGGALIGPHFSLLLASKVYFSVHPLAEDHFQQSL